MSFKEYLRDGGAERNPSMVSKKFATNSRHITKCPECFGTSKQIDRDMSDEDHIRFLDENGKTVSNISKAAKCKSCDGTKG